MRDERVAPLVDLLPEVRDVELHDAGAAAEVVVPHAVEDLRLRDDTALVAHEEAQQLELGGRQLYRRAAALDLVAVLVEAQVADAQDRLDIAGVRGPGAAHEAAEARDDLFEAERLGDVVVAAGREARDAIAHGILRRQEQHGHVVAGLPEALQHRHPVEVGHHDVEHQGVRSELPRGLERLEAGTGGADLPALHAERHRQQVGEHLLVIDDEDAQGRAVGAVECGCGWPCPQCGGRIYEPAMETYVFAVRASALRVLERLQPRARAARRSDRASKSSSTCCVARIRVVVREDAARALVERDGRTELGHERPHLRVVEDHRVGLVADRPGPRSGPPRRSSRRRRARAPAIGHARGIRQPAVDLVPGGACVPVMWKASPIAAGLPSRPAKATAKSSLWVIVQRLVPSPCTMTGLPARMRAISVHPPRFGQQACGRRCATAGRS